MQQRTLYRSRDDRMLAGVCGGIGGYFAVDPTLVRLAFVLMAAFTGVGVLAYIVLWIVVPEEGGRPLYEEWKSRPDAQASPEGAPNGAAPTAAAAPAAPVTPDAPAAPVTGEPPAASAGGPVPVTGAWQAAPQEWHMRHEGRRSGGVGLGIILIVVGGVLLVHRLVPQLNIDIWKLWPLLIIAIGLGMVLRPRRR